MHLLTCWDSTAVIHNSEPVSGGRPWIEHKRLREEQTSTFEGHFRQDSCRRFREDSKCELEDGSSRRGITTPAAYTWFRVEPATSRIGSQVSISAITTICLHNMAPFDTRAAYVVLACRAANFVSLGTCVLSFFASSGALSYVKSIQ